MVELDKITCRDLLPMAIPDHAVVAELGVYLGEFSETLLQLPNIDLLYSIDAWGDEAHPEKEYQSTVERLAPYGNRNSILRMKFDEAVKKFPDGHFDLVYVDGYAHEGEDNGRTFWDWWPKVKSGGIFAGHDYCKRHWPLVPLHLDRFAEHHGLNIHVTSETSDPQAIIFPSWIIRKP